MKNLITFFIVTVHLAAADIVGTDLINGLVTSGIKNVPNPPTVELTGTLPGRRALCAGTASAAFLFLKDGEGDPVAPSGTFFNRYLVANATVVVVVHKQNPTSQLKLSELKGLFAKESRDVYLNWGDLSNGTLSEMAAPIVYAPSGAFIDELFKGLVLEGNDYRQGVRQRLEWKTVTENITARFGVVAIMPSLPAGSPGRLMPIADGRPGRSQMAYPPNEVNIYNGDYPIRLPLYLYVRSDREKELRNTLVWILSDTFAEGLQKQGLSPAPKSIRSRLTQRLDR
jgi:hypothetical protein